MKQEYKIIRADSVDELERSVNAHLNCDRPWELVGTFQIAIDDAFETSYLQAVKREKKSAQVAYLFGHPVEEADAEAISQIVGFDARDILRDVFELFVVTKEEEGQEDDDPADASLILNCRCDPFFERTQYESEELFREQRKEGEDE